jgi:hypothetical protein
MIVSLSLVWQKKFAKRALPTTRNTFRSRLPLHLLMTLVFGATHTSMMYAVRTPIYEWVGLGDYGKWYGIFEYRLMMAPASKMLSATASAGTSNYTLRGRKLCIVLARA